MIRVAIGGIILAAALSGSVVAADLIVDEPVYEAAMDAAHDWNGAYVGAFVGYGAGEAIWGNTFGDLEVPIEGWLAGVTAGANFQMDSFVLGVEGDVAWSGIGGGVDCPNAAFECSTDINWLSTLRARAGFAADTALFYATAGVAVADVEHETDDGITSSVGTATYIGWTAGVGVEVAVSDNVSIKGEYLYVDLGEQTIPAADLGAGGDVPISITAHTAKLGLNFAF